MDRLSLLNTEQGGLGTVRHRGAPRGGWGGAGQGGTHIHCVVSELFISSMLSNSLRSGDSDQL